MYYYYKKKISNFLYITTLKILFFPVVLLWYLAKDIYSAWLEQRGYVEDDFFDETDL